MKPSSESLPASVRKACFVLGLNSQEITKERVLELWTKQVCALPKTDDGANEVVLSLNDAKDTLIRWFRFELP